MKTGFLRLVILTMGISSFASAQQLSPKVVDAYLSDLVNAENVPGLAVAIVQNGEVVYTGAFGSEKLGNSEPVTPEHNFALASISKTFVATAIVQLVQAGKIDLNTPVIEYLPYFELTDERFREITVVQILNHTSGMPDVEDYGYDNPQFDEGAAEQWVRQIDVNELLSEPGEIFHYSDMAFDVLGDLIAKTSGMSFEEYMQIHIFEPLGMQNSSFFYPDIDEDLRTSGHIDNPAVASEIYPYNRRHAPSSTLNSSVSEMTHWMLAHLGRGEFQGQRILTPEYFDLLWTPTLDIPQGPEIGLSWIIFNLAGHKVAMHAGADVGFRSQLMLFPDDNAGWVIASNWQETDLRAISSALMDLMFDSGESPE